MAAAEPNHTECPVCHEDYKDPKILKCAHIVCRKCVVTWLSKGGNQGGCPLCRTPILPAFSKGQSDVGSTVDALPTDLIMAAVVESRHILSSANRCVCDDNTEAKFLCLNCRMKLCDSCTKSHMKFPATKHHTVEDLSNISEEKLAGFHESSCNNHENKAAELYCRSHGELICVVCASSDHRQCMYVGGIKEEAKVQREELKKQLERFKEKEKAIVEKIKELDRQIADGKVKGQKVRADIKTTFDDLKQTLDNQFKKLTKNSSQNEEKFIAQKNAPRTDLATHRAGLGVYSQLMEKVASASDDFLLGIQGKLKEHLHDLESHDIRVEASKGVTDLEGISLDTQLVSTLKELICKLGEVDDEYASCSQCGYWVSNKATFCLRCGQKKTKVSSSGLGEPEYASFMKVGDQVRHGTDWNLGYQVDDEYASCSQCGYQDYDKNKFCPNCGYQKPSVGLQYVKSDEEAMPGSVPTKYLHYFQN